MKRLYLLAAAVVFVAGPALAQAIIELNPQQEATLYTELYEGTTTGSGSTDVMVSVGKEIPETVVLKPVPRTVKVEGVAKYRYAVVGQQVVLVEPESRKIVRIHQEVELVIVPGLDGSRRCESAGVVFVVHERGG